MKVPNSVVQLILMFSVASVLNCNHQSGSYESQLKMAEIPQLRSASFSGQGKALFVNEQDRDLRVTIDGGQTWRLFPAKAVVDGFECATLTATNRLWAVSHKGRVFTVNYADSVWTETFNLKQAAAGDFSGAKQIEFVNESLGWILGSLSIWHTRDGGVTWTKTLSVSTPGIHGQPTGMFIINETTLIAIGTEGQVFLTKDNGTSWQIQTLGNKPDFKDVWFTNERTGWICGFMSGRESIRMVLFATKDGGSSWNEMPLDALEVLPSSLCFVENEGWISGQEKLEGGLRKAVLLHSDDGGAHWADRPLPDNDPIAGEIRFTNKQNGWLVGQDSVYRSDDGGKSWRRLTASRPTL